MSEVAGRLEIPVESDTTGFAAALKRKVEAAAKNVVATIRAEVDASSVKESLEAKVKEAAEGVTAHIGVDLEKGTEAKLRAKLETVVKAAAAGITAQVGVEVDKKTAREMRNALDGSKGKAIEVPARVDRKGLFASWFAARKAIQTDAKRKPIDLPFTPKSFRSAFMPVIYAGLASLIQPLIAIIGGSLGGLAAMAGNLASIVQTLAAAPAAVGAFGLGITAVTLGIKRLSGEMKDILPELQPVRREFDKIGERWKKIGDGVAITFWKDLKDQIRPTADVLLPLLNTALTDSAKRLSAVAVSSAKWMQTPLFSKQFASVTKDSNKLLGAMGEALLGWAKGILNMADAAGPLVDRLSGFIRRTGDWAAGIAAPGEKAKKFAEELEYAGDKAAQLWKMLKDLGAAVKNVFLAGRGTGDRLLESLEKTIEGWRTFTESTDGKNKIKKWFEDVEPIAREVGGLIVDVAKALGRMAADPNVGTMVKSIRDDLLPTLERFLNNLGRTVGPSVISFISELLGVLTEFSEAGSPIGRGLGYIADGLGLLGDFLQAHPRLAQTLGVILGGLLAYRALAYIGKITGVFALLDGLQGRLGNGALRLSMVGFSLALGGLTGAFTGLPGPANGAAAALGTFLLLQPLVGPMATALSNLMRNARINGGGFRGMTTAIGTKAGSGIRGALSGLAGALGIGAAGGPAGAAIAVGLGVVALAVGKWAQSHADAKAKAQSYKQLVDDITASLEKETGALTEATRLRINEELINNGAAKAARQYGVDLKTLADAAAGNTDAQRDLNKQLGESALKMAMARDSTGTLGKAMKLAGVSQSDLATAVMKGGAALDPYVDKMLQAANGDNYMMGVLETLIPGLYTAADGHRVVADKAGASAKAVAAAADKYDLLAGMAGNSRKQVETVIAAVGKTKGKTFEMKALTSESIKRLRDMGYSVKYNAKSKTFTITAKANVAAANAAAQRASRNRTAYITYRARWAGNHPNSSSSSYHGGGGQADGSILSFTRYANGGFHSLAEMARNRFKSFANGAENHIAQIARPGDWRVWAEPETGGEAYIPLSMSKRGRSMQILAEVARRFGMALAPQVEGLGRSLAGVSRAMPSAAAPMAQPGRGFNQGPRIEQKFAPGSITVSNPAPEPASRSIANNLRHTSEFGILEGDD